MEKLKELISLCKASVTIEVNDHKDIYQSVEDYIKESDEEIDAEVFKEMVALDTIIRIQAYPDTPIGFYVCYHYDLEKCLDTVIEAIKTSRKTSK